MAIYSKVEITYLKMLLLKKSLIKILLKKLTGNQAQPLEGPLVLSELSNALKK